MGYTKSSIHVLLILSNTWCTYVYKYARSGRVKVLRETVVLLTLKSVYYILCKTNSYLILISPRIGVPH